MAAGLRARGFSDGGPPPSSGSRTRNQGEAWLPLHGESQWKTHPPPPLCKSGGFSAPALGGGDMPPGPGTCVRDEGTTSGESARRPRGRGRAHPTVPGWGGPRPREPSGGPTQRTAGLGQRLCGDLAGPDSQPRGHRGSDGELGASTQTPALCLAAAGPRHAYASHLRPQCGNGPRRQVHGLRPQPRGQAPGRAPLRLPSWPRPRRSGPAHVEGQS